VTGGGGGVVTDDRGISRNYLRKNSMSSTAACGGGDRLKVP
jgi:hypothetical protein